jgi:VanZ like family
MAHPDLRPMADTNVRQGPGQSEGTDFLGGTTRGATAGTPRGSWPSPLTLRWARVAALAVILLLTLTPTQATELWRGWSNCVVCGEDGASDMVLNVLLFLPLGLLFGLRARRRWIWLPLAMFLSLGIELTQLVIPGRYSTLSDVITNTTGAGIGLLLAAALEAEPATRRRLTQVGMVTATLLPWAVLGATAWLFQPVYPPTVYYGQWTADLGGGMVQYEGRVVSASIDGLRLPSWRLRDTPLTRTLLAQGAPLHVEAVAGPPPPALAPVFSIYDDRVQEILLLGVNGDALVVHRRLRAGQLHFDQPELRIAHGAAGLVPGRPFVLDYRGGPGPVCLSVDYHVHCGLVLSTADGWALLLDGRLPMKLPVAMRTGWLALLLMPLGLLAPRRRGPAVALAALAITALAVVPAITGLGAPGPMGWAGAVLGLLIGRLLRTYSMVRLPPPARPESFGTAATSLTR